MTTIPPAAMPSRAMTALPLATILDPLRLSANPVIDVLAWVTVKAIAGNSATSVESDAMKLAVPERT
jgi:hypothetical protein